MTTSSKAAYGSRCGILRISDGFGNGGGGSVIESVRNPGTFEQQKNVVFYYGLYYNNSNTNLIRKPISVMGIVYLLTIILPTQKKCTGRD